MLHSPWIPREIYGSIGHLEEEVIMLKIPITEKKFQDLLRMDGTKLFLDIFDNKLSFEVVNNNESIRVALDKPAPYPDTLIEYDYDDFKALLRVTKRFKGNDVYLNNDMGLYLSPDKDSFFIMPLEKRIESTHKKHTKEGKE